MAMKKKKERPEDFLPYERLGESLYEKESRWAEAILANERARNKPIKWTKAQKKLSRGPKLG
jgi:hypothetical protein